MQVRCECEKVYTPGKVAQSLTNEATLNPTDKRKTPYLIGWCGKLQRIAKSKVISQ